MKILKSLISATLLFGTTAFANDTISIQVGYSPGGSYDGAARVVAEHLGKYIEGNPEIVVENIPGAGSVKLAKLIMQDDGQSGIKIATVSSTLAVRPIFRPDSEDYNPTKAHYLVAMSDQPSYCVASKSSGITSLQEFLDNADAKAGATGKGSGTYTNAASIKAALGGKYEIVTGFKGASEINLAMDRGEIDVRCGISRTSLLASGFIDRVNVIVELGLEPRSEFEGVDFIMDFIPDDKKEAMKLMFVSQSIHHPFVMGPNADPETVKMLRDAFDKMVADPEFLAAAVEKNFTFRPTSGVDVEAAIAAILDAPANIQEQARTYVK